MDNCDKFICSSNFGHLGLYVNFDGPNLETIKYLFKDFMNRYRLNQENFSVAYCSPSWIYLQKNGLHSSLENIRWLSELGNERLNFFKNLEEINVGYENLFNYLNHHNALVLFIGDLTDDMKFELNRYLTTDSTVMIIHLYAEKGEVQLKRWVGDNSENIVKI